jgi:hypothetical protein
MIHHIHPAYQCAQHHIWRGSICHMFTECLKVRWDERVQICIEQGIIEV